MPRSQQTRKAAAKKMFHGGKLIRSKGASRGVIVKLHKDKTIGTLKVTKEPKVIKYRLIKTAGTSQLLVGTIRQKFGVSQEELARVTGYSTRSIAGWEGGQALSDSARQKLAETERLRAALSQIMPPDSLGGWLRTPNSAFEGQTPIQVIERGESDRLWHMIFQVDANVAS